ncbi:hypothetical protein [Criibacterium bergeronii]|uniref:Uncharacterized protein n=1 Tax=Criibacterium bergeronii TaxID=1871336 RepID=A0A1C0AG64_9FIRM|nr:hypothetical protein [Criibacterium bergeronii]RDY21427.1 hypothetical protein BBG48_004725 [Criibacterium bergeronii]
MPNFNENQEEKPLKYRKRLESAYLQGFDAIFTIKQPGSSARFGRVLCSFFIYANGQQNNTKKIINLSKKY